MGNSLDKFTIKGFKSIRALVDFELTNLNVLVGGNGSGKSNLISFFKMLCALIDGNLTRYVRDNGGAGDILFNGRKVTEKMEFETRFGIYGFRFKLVPMPGNIFAFEDEACFYKGETTGLWRLGDSDDGSSQMVAEVNEKIADAKYSKSIFDAISSWQIYHFRDTSDTASMRNYEMIDDNKVLRADASNIGPFLYKLKNEHPKEYKNILDAIRLIMPFFGDFILEPRESGVKKEVNLSWIQKGSDFPLQPSHLSDGSIRYICLVTTLLQPNPLSTIIVDEPELGLHPAAIVILGELIEVASKRTQVIVATQSPALMDQFGIDDMIVVTREDGATTFKRLNEKDFSEWLKSYSVGELWMKNVISGGPIYE